MTNTDHKSSDEIEREVERTRARVTETLEELRSRMTPGQIVDEFVDYARESGGGDFVRNLGQAVRDNPLPVLLIGAGISWLMFSNAAGRSGRGAREEDYEGYRGRSYGGVGSREEPSYVPGGVAGYGYGADEGAAGAVSGSIGDAGRRASDVAGRIGSAASDAASGVGDAAGRAASAVSDAASSVYEGVSNVAGRVASAASGALSGASSVLSGAGGTLSEAGSRVSGAVSGTQHQAYRMSRGAHHGLFQLLEQQPLVLGALGIAIGAAIGAALPSTETEDQLLGETSDALKEQAQGVLSDQYEKVGAVAARVAEEVKDEARAQGLDLSSAGQAVRSVGEKLRSVAETATEAARDEAEKQNLAVGGTDDSGPRGSGSQGSETQPAGPGHLPGSGPAQGSGPQQGPGGPAHGSGQTQDSGPQHGGSGQTQGPGPRQGPGGPI